MDEVQKLANTQCEEDRLVVLQQLVDQLSPTERHALAGMLSIKNDRLAALPVELVIQVLIHLPLLYTWTLRLVCRRWRHLLTSEQVVDAALKRWDTHKPEDRVSSSQAIETSEAILRRMQSWSLGRPFTKCVKHIDIANSNGMHLLQATRTYALSGPYFAYIEARSRDGHRVIVLNLLTGKQTRYQGAARENIMSLSLTTSIIAYISFSGKLYASKHDHSQLGSVKLPSASVAAFGAHRDTVGVVLQGASSGPATVILYDCSNRITRDFPVDTFKVEEGSSVGVRFPIRALLVNEDAGTVDVFGQYQETTDASARSKNTYVEHWRYSFAGKHLSSSSWKRLGTRMESWPNDAFNLADLHHTGGRDLHVFRTTVLQSADQLSSLSTGKPPQQMLLCFDASEARLVEYCLPNEYQLSSKRSPDSDTRAYRVYPMLWKSLVIRADAVLHFGTMDDTDRHQIQNSLRLRSRGNERPSQVLLNESFLVATSWLSQAEEWHADIFCFEEGLEWAVDGSEITSTYLWDATTSTSRTDCGR